MNNYILEMKGIYKTFGGIVALNHVDFFLRRGEIHALVGENGAGKSTLMKVLSGAYKQDSGEIIFEGEKLSIRNPSDSLKKGISVIYQEFMLAPDLSVAENIFIDKLAEKRSIINWKKVNTSAKELLSSLGFSDINPEEKVANLSVAYQQVVEICKCLSRNSKILVFDEPTAVLTVAESEKLFSIIDQLKNNNVSIIYISHRLEEIFRLADRISVFKDGVNISTTEKNNISIDELVLLMVGREISQMFPEHNHQIGEEVLKVNNFSISKNQKPINFSVKRGEILGFSGLVGSGRTEIMRAIFGADSFNDGEVYINGKKHKYISPRESIKQGIGMLPEDRKQQGLLLEQSIQINTSLPVIDKFTKFFVIDKKLEKKEVVSTLAKFNTKYRDTDNNVSTLSGGNQQKVSLSKWILSDCECLILDEPTRGVDVGAKTEIYKIIEDLAQSGLAIILISSEMAEIIGMCDRVLVMREGQIAGELTSEISEEKIIKLAMGV